MQQLCKRCSDVDLPSPTHTHTHTEYRDAFALFDKRGDGKIDSDQIGDVLRALNLNPTETEVKKIVQEVDPNGEKSLAYYHHGWRILPQAMYTC